MILNYQKIYLLVLLLLVNCTKEIDIAEFSDDFINYESELRIEALILPANNTAIVRIDKSVLIDDTYVYNCKDDDYGTISQDSCNTLGGTWHGLSEDLIADCGDWVVGKWTCWTCSGAIELNPLTYGTAFVNNPDECTEVCIENLYSGCEEYTSVDNLSQCEGLGGIWSWFILHDIGEDGISGDPTDDDGDCEDCSLTDSGCQENCRNEYSIGENNGIPDCGEPNVDETDEIIQNVHQNNCSVTITNGDTECIFEYDENAGTFFYDSNLESWGDLINNIQISNYGAYIPSETCMGFEWNNLEADYDFECTCPGYGTIVSESSIQISPPVVFYNKSDVFSNSGDTQDFINSISICENNQDLKKSSSLWSPNNSKYDTLYFAKNSYNEFIYYSSLSPYFYYQNVQYYYDYSSLPPRYLYYHGHPDGATEVENIYGNASLMGEAIITAEVNEFLDAPNINKFKYEMFTLSESYKNYYFYDLLDLRDPVRTNLRKLDSGETVMGAFGSMSSEEIYFELIDCEEYISKLECEDSNITKFVCNWYSFIELPDYIQESMIAELIISECENGVCSGEILNGKECQTNEDCIINVNDINLEELNLCGPNNLPPAID